MRITELSPELRMYRAETYGALPATEDGEYHTQVTPDLGGEQVAKVTIWEVTDNLNPHDALIPEGKWIQLPAPFRSPLHTSKR